MSTDNKKKNVSRLVSIVIPCYNEEDGIPYLVLHVKGVKQMLAEEGYDCEFILVNDGSTDKTLKFLEIGFQDIDGVRIISYEKNKGFGGALRSGLEQVKGDLVVTIDADSNYDHFEIPEIIKCLSDDYDVITASPWHPGGAKSNFPIHRFIFSVSLSRLYSMLLGSKIPNISTYSSGFRVYRRAVIDSVKFEANDFLATAEILIRTLKAGYRVKEYPTVVYQRKFGQSKLKTFKTIRSHLGFMLKLWREKE